MTESYRLEGVGSSYSDARQSLGNKKSDLTRKLTSAQVSSTFPTDKVAIEVSYDLKDTSNGPDLRSFQVKASNSDELAEKTKGYLKLANAKIGQYNSEIVISEIVTLSDDQYKAVVGRRPPVAGNNESSSLTSRFSDFL